MNIDIPLKSYLIKYLAKKYCIDTNYRLSLEDPFGISIFYMLKSVPKHYRPKKYGQDVIHVDLAGYSRKEKIYLNNECIVRLNSQFDLIFRGEIYKHIDLQQQNGVYIHTAIYKFFAEYGLNEQDLSQDTLMRTYLRYKKSGKIRNRIGFKEIAESVSSNLSSITHTPWQTSLNFREAI